jgi:surface protein
MKTNKAKDMSYMFYNCISLNKLELSNFDTNFVTDMRYMFSSCKSISYLNLTSFNTLNCKSFLNMFSETNDMNVTINKQNNSQLISEAPININFDFTDSENENIFY